MSNILIIDDDQLICEMLFRRIEYLGHDAVYAKILIAGLEHLSSDNDGRINNLIIRINYGKYEDHA